MWVNRTTELDEGSMTEERVFAELQSDASTLHRVDPDASGAQFRT